MCQTGFSHWTRGQFFENPGDHADEMETSLMLYPEAAAGFRKRKVGKWGREEKQGCCIFRRLGLGRTKMVTSK